MIKSKKELRFYIMADRMMNSGSFSREYFVKRLLCPNHILDYLEYMRKVSYYTSGGGKNLALKFWYKYRFRKLGLKLGFSIGANCLGYGTVIPHYGTIIVGNSNIIGNYAVLHTSTTISDNNKKIGNGLYLSTGVKITSRITLGDGVSIGANSVVNKSFDQDNILIAGMPAVFIKNRKIWYEEENSIHLERVKLIEDLKRKLF